MHRECPRNPGLGVLDENWLAIRGATVWNFDPQPDETATWTGECSAGFAQGPGTLIWTYREGSQEHQASRRFGQPARRVRGPGQ